MRLWKILISAHGAVDLWKWCKSWAEKPCFWWPIDFHMNSLCKTIQNKVYLSRNSIPTLRKSDFEKSSFLPMVLLTSEDDKKVELKKHVSDDLMIFKRFPCAKQFNIKCIYREIAFWPWEKPTLKNPHFCPWCCWPPKMIKKVELKKHVSDDLLIFTWIPCAKQLKIKCTYPG